MNNLLFKKLDFKELSILMEWAKNEGWNPGKQDAEIFWKTDPDGFYGLFNGVEMIGGGALVSYEEKFGTMGLFIIHPKYRGEGLGRNLWYKRRDTLLSRLESGAAIGMDGILHMQTFYVKGGFSIAFRNMRFMRKGASFKIDPCVIFYTDNDKNELTNYDLQCMGYQRNRFLHNWIHQEKGRTFVYREHGILKGYAVIREAETGMRIGPLFADNQFIAEALYKACLTHAGEHDVFVDIPLNHVDAVALFDQYSLTPVFECARMYLGTPPPLNIHKIFALTCPELG